MQIIIWEASEKQNSRSNKAQMKAYVDIKPV